MYLYLDEKCLDCKNSKDIEPGNYCRMFIDVPEHLPCGQHDMFLEQRRAMGKLIIKNPFILADIIQEYMIENKEIK